MDKQAPNRIIVAGTGPVGLIAALSLAHRGLDVVLVGPEVSADDSRTTALMRPALSLLDQLGVLAELEQKAAPLKVMRIVDATSRLIRSPVVTFRAGEIGEEYFGLNIPNADMNAALAAAVAAHGGIDRRAELVESWVIGSDRITANLAGGTAVDASLAVAADGRLSKARDAAGITATTRSYPQSALVLSFDHTRDHEFISTEFHTETGPFTQVPLPGRRSSLVWVLKPEAAVSMDSLADQALSRHVEDAMQSMLGRVTVEGRRQIYPLSATLPLRFAQNRVALVGEAAHVFPPIGAQGLNLGVRDVVDLTDIVVQHGTNPGSSQVMTAYDRKRRPDIVARATAVNLLNMSLLSDMLPAQMARSAGLGMIGAVAPLRAFFMREGLRPGSGAASIVSDLRKQVRRQGSALDQPK